MHSLSHISSLKGSHNYRQRTQISAIYDLIFASSLLHSKNLQQMQMSLMQLRLEEAQEMNATVCNLYSFTPMFPTEVAETPLRAP